MQEDYAQFIDKLKLYINKHINSNTIQNLDIEGVMRNVISGWRSLGTTQSIQYGSGAGVAAGAAASAQYTVGNNNSSAPIVSE